MSAVLTTLDRAEAPIVETLQVRRTAPLDPLFESLSSPWLRLLLLAAGVGVATYVRRSWRPAAATTVAVVIAAALAALAKQLVHRPRPPLTDHAIHALGRLPSSSSFPSSHAATAFAAAVVLATVLATLRNLALATAAAVAFSRLWLGVHYPTDVIAGALIGTVAALATLRAVESLPSLRRHLHG
jgi:decaprenylphosphoryl-5-phosphoribose phosphatase